MDITLSPGFKDDLKRIKKNDPQLLTKIHKQLKLFSENPRHPSLRTHKLTGNLDNSWSISIDRSFRLIYTVSAAGEAYFYSLGTHDQVYR